MMSYIHRVLSCLILSTSIFFTPGHAEEKPIEKASSETTEDIDQTTQSLPSFDNIGNKMLLDEQIRYIRVPEKDLAFGLVRERKVRPKMDTWVAYDDNIYLTKDATKNDIITHLSPGVYAYYGNEDNLYFAFYDADILIYGKNQNETRINQTIGVRADLFRKSRVKVTVKDTLRPTTDPATSESAAFVKRIYNDFESIVLYDISERTAVSITYDQYFQDYTSNEYKSFSYLQHVVSPTAYWHLSPKTSLTAEYDIGITDYRGAKYNSTYHQGRAGIQGRLTPKSTVYLKAGYQYRIYDKPDRKNTGDAILEGIYNYTLSPKTGFELIAAKRINESVYEDDGFFKSINVYASMTHHILYNLDLKISGCYIRSDYPRESEIMEQGLRKRSDNIYGASARLEYKFRYWLSAYTGYDFKIRDSNIRRFEYEDNIVYAGSKISF